MVGKLEYKGRDPNNKGRGAGWYWLRGKGVYSKYTGKVDSKVKTDDDNRIVVKNADERLSRQMEYPHVGDYRGGKSKMRRTTKKKWKGHKLPKTPKGYY